MDIEEQPSAEKPARISRRWVIGIVIVVVCFYIAWGLFSLLTSFRSTMMSSAPGNSDRLSTSMEPIDLSLKSDMRGSTYLPEGAEPIEWHLRLPRAYLRFEVGTNESVYDRKNKCCSHNIVFRVVYNEKTDSFQPATLSTVEEQRDSGMDILIQNSMAMPELVPQKNCVRSDDMTEFIRAKGQDTSVSFMCPRKDGPCTIYSHVDGWNAEYRVPLKLYAQPEKVCTAVRKLLDQYTVKRDVRY